MANTLMESTDVGSKTAERPSHHGESSSTQIDTVASDTMDLDRPENTRSDHDRQPVEDFAQINTTTEDLPQPTVSNDQSMMDIDPAAGNVEAKDDEISLAQLQRNMGEAFLLCRNRKTPFVLTS